MREATIEVRGLTPLLMHSTAGMLKEPTKGLKSKSDNLTGREEAEVGAYRDDEHYLVMPTVAFGRALYKAASGRKVGKSTARTALAGVLFTSEFVRLFDPESNDDPIKDFDVDTRFVKIGNARVPRSRARIEIWGARLHVEYDDELIDEYAIIALLELAGKTVGVGDYRPETGGGPFGRFVVVKE